MRMPFLYKIVKKLFDIFKMGMVILLTKGE